MNGKSLGEIISEKRKEKGMTQAELAEKMGVTDKAVSKWERNLSYPDVASFPRLSEVLGVSLDELMKGTGDSNKKKDNDIERIISVALRAIALAMGVAVTVLTLLDELDSDSGLGMLGIAVLALSVYLFRERKG